MMEVTFKRYRELPTDFMDHKKWEEPKFTHEKIDGIDVARKKDHDDLDKFCLALAFKFGRKYGYRRLNQGIRWDYIKFFRSWWDKFRMNEDIKWDYKRNEIQYRNNERSLKMAITLAKLTGAEKVEPL